MVSMKHFPESMPPVCTYDTLTVFGNARTSSDHRQDEVFVTDRLLRCEVFPDLLSDISSCGRN